MAHGGGQFNKKMEQSIGPSGCNPPSLAQFHAAETSGAGEAIIIGHPCLSQRLGETTPF